MISPSAFHVPEEKAPAKVAVPRHVLDKWARTIERAWTVREESADCGFLFQERPGLKSRAQTIHAEMMSLVEVHDLPAPDPAKGGTPG